MVKAPIALPASMLGVLLLVYELLLDLNCRYNFNNLLQVPGICDFIINFCREVTHDHLIRAQSTLRAAHLHH